MLEVWHVYFISSGGAFIKTTVQREKGMLVYRCWNRSKRSGSQWGVWNCYLIILDSLLNTFLLQSWCLVVVTSKKSDKSSEISQGWFREIDIVRLLRTDFIYGQHLFTVAFAAEWLTVINAAICLAVMIKCAISFFLLFFHRVTWFECFFYIVWKM